MGPLRVFCVKSVIAVFSLRVIINYINYIKILFNDDFTVVIDMFNFVETNKRKPSAFGYASLAISVLLPILILVVEIMAIQRGEVGGNIFFQIFFCPVVPLVFGSVAIYRDEKKWPAILGIVFSIIIPVLLFIGLVYLALGGLNSVW